MRNIKELNDKKKFASQEKAEFVKRIIHKMNQKGEKINFYTVQKETGVSKSFLYNNLELRALIEKMRLSCSSENSASSRKDVLIKTLRSENTNLKKTIQSFEEENGETYKTRCKKLEEENQKLKKKISESITF